MAYSDVTYDNLCKLNFCTYLEIREGFIRENQTTAEKYTGGQISGVRKRRDQRDRSHLPIVREYSRTQKQPTIQRCQVAKSQQSEIKKSTI